MEGVAGAATLTRPTFWSILPQYGLARMLHNTRRFRARILRLWPRSRWEVNAWSIYSRFSLLSERRNWTTVHPGLEIENDVRELKSSHKELA